MSAFKPPTRNGIGPSCVGLPAGSWPTLLDFLTARFPNVSPQTWLARMARGDVIDERGQAISPERASHAPYPAHQRLFYYREVPNEPRIPFDEVVLYQDDHLLVVDKPHFLPVVPSGGYLTETVLVRLKNKLGLNDLVPIHRIDRDTAGLVLFAKQPASRAAYCALFSQHQVRKTYEAIAPWRAGLSWPVTRSSRIQEAGHFMLQHEVPGAPNAITHMDVLEVHGELARYQLKPVTGQRHQLRVHMLGLGLPILNDGLYPTLTPEGQLDHAHPLQLLAKRLEFIDPVSGEPRQFESARKLSLVEGPPSGRWMSAP
ncbi:pseudouridine synthase [Rhodoferax sp.]|uniref:pseudouridine synthase n=1 Tax=Rhodoferax sp. TaxID=50421 RepID=UPI0027305635|nr:pseudouridine synthase [Rhodoferax sp.]MDP1531807.1 pseudouridine synthase [Rhodoferax sp.]MDP1944363.1 pseudouridine synthase [Rhodoferax sp.]MDP2442450.1 pseudouridine synthase [Rhodoferax sp.]MDZ4209196.1 pseudouridine synthase [Rhodoferax sp.]